MKQQSIYAFNETVCFYSSSKEYREGMSFVVPNMDEFIHDVSEHGNIGALKKRLLNLNLFQIFQLIWWNKTNLLSIAKKEFSAGVVMLIQIELLKLMKYQPKMIILSDKVSDLTFALNNRAILMQTNKLVKTKLGLDLAIMTNNLPTAITKLAEWKVNPNFIFTPINHYGYEMNPSKQSVEQVLPMVDEEKIIAIIPEESKEETTYLQAIGVNKRMTGWFS